MAFRARVGRYRSRSSRRSLIERHLDVVNTVTVRANGRPRHSPRHGLSVNALNELRRFGAVTLAARSWNVDLGNRRLRIRCGLDIVTVMTVGTHGRAGIPASHGFRVNALSIRQKRPIADAASQHHRFVTVALAARLGNRRSVDGRIWIAGREDRRHVAILRVAIKTRCRFRTIVNGLGVETMIVGSVGSGVKQ